MTNEQLALLLEQVNERYRRGIEHAAALLPPECSETRTTLLGEYTSQPALDELWVAYKELEAAVDTLRSKPAA